MLEALVSRNNYKSCALGMGGQTGGMRDEKGHFPAARNKSYLVQVVAVAIGTAVEDELSRRMPIGSLTSNKTNNALQKVFNPIASDLR